MSSKKSKRSNDNDDKMKKNLIYFSYEASKKKEGDGDTDIIEKKVKHSEDEFFCKYYEKINGKITKISVKAPSKGGEYTLTIKKDNGDGVDSNMNKKELIEFLKKKGNENLDFILTYVNNKNTKLAGGAKSLSIKTGGAKKKVSSGGKKKASSGGAKKKTGAKKKDSSGSTKKKKTSKKPKAKSGKKK